MSCGYSTHVRVLACRAAFPHSMTGGDDADPEALQGGERARGGLQRVLAPVARAGVDVAHGQGGGAAAGQAGLAADAVQLAQEEVHQRSAQA